MEPEPEPPCEGLMLCEEPTLEGLEQLLERGQPSAGIFSDEGGRLVRGHAMNTDNALKTACGLSNLWDRKPLTRVRKSEESKIHYGRRLAVHLMIQPVVLMQLLSNEMLLGQGLLRLHNETIEARGKYRRGGEQRVVVQHVQVNNGGKTIVGGNLAMNGGGGNKK